MSSPETLDFCWWNIHGNILHDSKKSKILKLLELHHFVGIAEPWLFKTDENSLKKDYPYHHVYVAGKCHVPPELLRVDYNRESQATFRHGGTAVIINKEMDILLVRRALTGRHILIRARFRGKTWIFGAVYAPVEPRESLVNGFWEDLTKDFFSIFREGDLVALGGDWNAVENPLLDRKKSDGSAASFDIKDNTLRDYIIKLGLTDTWKIAHLDDSEQFSFSCYNHDSRLDRIYFGTTLLPSLLNSKIFSAEECLGSDHRIVSTRVGPFPIIPHSIVDDSPPPPPRFNTTFATPDQWTAFQNDLQDRSSNLCYQWNLTDSTPLDQPKLDEWNTSITKLLNDALSFHFPPLPIKKSSFSAHVPASTHPLLALKRSLIGFKLYLGSQIRKHASSTLVWKSIVLHCRANRSIYLPVISSFDGDSRGCFLNSVQMVVVHEELKQVIKTIKTQWDNLEQVRIKAAKARFFERLEQKATLNPSAFFAKVKRNGTSSGPPRLVKVRDTYSSDPKKVKEAFMNYFEGLLGSSTKTQPKDHSHLPWRAPAELREDAKARIERKVLKNFSSEEFLCAASNSTKGKAPGFDRIPTEAWSYIPPNLLTCVLSLFNLCRDLNSVPNSWKSGQVFSIHKGGDTSLLENYRGITLINTIYKIFSKIITERLSTALEDENAFSNGQIGFRKDQTIPNHHNTFINTLEHRKRFKRGIHIIYIDLCKAFDSIQHWSIRFHLLFYVTIRCANFLEIFFVGTSCCIITPYGLTDSIFVERGVRQGDPISPLIFIIVMDPGIKWIEVQGYGYNWEGRFRLSILAFADDIILIAKSQHHIKLILEMFGSFCKFLELVINILKSAYSFRKKGEDSVVEGKRITKSGPSSALDADKHLKISNSNTPFPFLESWECYKWLGIWICIDLKWKKHEGAMHEKIFDIHCALEYYHQAPEWLITKSIETLIISKFRFSIGCVNFSQGFLYDVDRTHAKLLRKCCGSVNRFSNEWIFGDPKFGAIGLTSVCDLSLQMRVNNFICYGTDSQSFLSSASTNFGISISIIAMDNNDLLKEENLADRQVRFFKCLTREMSSIGVQLVSHKKEFQWNVSSSIFPHVTIKRWWKLLVSRHTSLSPFFIQNNGGWRFCTLKEVKNSLPLIEKNKHKWMKKILLTDGTISKEITNSLNNIPTPIASTTPQSVQIHIRSVYKSGYAFVCLLYGPNDKRNCTIPLPNTNSASLALLLGPLTVMEQMENTNVTIDFVSSSPYLVNFGKKFQTTNFSQHKINKSDHRSIVDRYQRIIRLRRIAKAQTAFNLLHKESPLVKQLELLAIASQSTASCAGKYNHSGEITGINIDGRFYDSHFPEAIKAKQMKNRSELWSSRCSGSFIKCKDVDFALSNKSLNSRKLGKKQTTFYRRLRSNYVGGYLPEKTALCDHCNVTETLEHTLLDCPQFSHFRTELKEEVNSLLQKETKSNDPHPVWFFRNTISNIIGVDNPLQKLINFDPFTGIRGMLPTHIKTYLASFKLAKDDVERVAVKCNNLVLTKAHDIYVARAKLGFSFMNKSK
eukprot:TRINITY_DN3433_c1_g2_i1.p1 TRINITY_DN3433_c1_g2~~TRINITY_DN3433_c1_g2_i1.p1  ORF type:complete len:1539 (+),score=122.15 TRINITY_DN3433_c1_g2_i1:1791-6407(+)